MIGASTRIIDSNADGEAIAPVLQKEKLAGLRIISGRASLCTRSQFGICC